MRNSTPLVSVVIPTYNCAAFLPDALKSICSQSYPNMEIIVVDDGSNDDTQHVLEPYLKKITYVRKKNGGVASARNAGMRYASGEYIAMMDADDICTKDRIAIQVGYLQKNPQIVLCSSDFSAFDETGIFELSNIASYYSIIHGTPGGIKELYPTSGMLDVTGIRWLTFTDVRWINVYSGQVYERLLWGNYIHPPTVMVKRSIVDAVGEFDETISIATEYDWLIRVSRLGDVGYIDMPLLRYRYRRSNEQLSSDTRIAQICLDTVATMEKIRLEDAEVFDAKKKRFKQRIGTCYQNAADALVETKKPDAFINLKKSLTHGLLNLQSLKILVKLVMPRRTLWLYRRRFR